MLEFTHQTLLYENFRSLLCMDGVVTANALVSTCPLKLLGIQLQAYIDNHMCIYLNFHPAERIATSTSGYLKWIPGESWLAHSYIT